MSIFHQVNEDAGGDLPTTSGARKGFLGAFEAAYDAQRLGWSQFGLERSFQDVEQEELDRHRERTGQSVDPVGFGTLPPYMALARHFEGQTDPNTALWLEQRQKEMGDGAMSYQDMWNEVKRRAAGAERSWETSTTTLAGKPGGFIGSVAAALNPKYDPLNFFSLGVGGIGKNVATRVLTEGAGQAGVEALNQFTGVTENRKLLGLGGTTAEALQQILFAGVLGSSFRGGTEAIGAGARAGFARWRAEPGMPPAPKPAEMSADVEAMLAPARQTYGPTRYADARFAEDMTRSVIAMERPDGEGMKALFYRLGESSALPADVTSSRMEIPHWYKDTSRPISEELDLALRNYDEDVAERVGFYDKVLEREKGVQRTLQDESQQVKENQLRNLDLQVANLEKQMKDPLIQVGKFAELESKVRDLRTQQGDIAANPDIRGKQAVAADLVKQRAKIAGIEQKRAALEPLIERARRIATGNYRSELPSIESLSLVDRLQKAGLALNLPVERAAETPGGRVAPAPGAKQGDAAAGAASPSLSPEAALAARAQSSSDVAIAESQALLENYLKVRTLETLNADGTPKEAMMQIDGVAVPLDRKIITSAVTEDGNVTSKETTLRSVMESLARDNDVIKAFTFCKVK